MSKVQIPKDVWNTIMQKSQKGLDEHNILKRAVYKLCHSKYYVRQCNVGGCDITDFIEEKFEEYIFPKLLYRFECEKCHEEYTACADHIQRDNPLCKVCNYENAVGAIFTDYERERIEDSFDDYVPYDYSWMGTEDDPLHGANLFNRELPVNLRRYSI